MNTVRIEADTGPLKVLVFRLAPKNQLGIPAELVATHTILPGQDAVVTVGNDEWIIVEDATLSKRPKNVALVEEDEG